MSEGLREGTVVGIWRRCRACRMLKPLEHYLLRNGRGKATGDVKICAACRMRKWDFR